MPTQPSGHLCALEIYVYEGTDLLNDEAVCLEINKRRNGRFQIQALFYFWFKRHSLEDAIFTVVNVA